MRTGRVAGGSVGVSFLWIFFGNDAAVAVDDFAGGGGADAGAVLGVPVEQVAA